MHAASAAQASDLLYEGCRDEFVVLTALLNLRRTLAVVSQSALGRSMSCTYRLQDPPVFAGQVADRFDIELHDRDSEYLLL